MPPKLVKAIGRYKGQWVTTSHDEQRLLGHGNTIDKALEMARKQGETEPFLIKVPTKGDTAFFF